MVIRATSDLHGSLPDIEPCDLLLIAGDNCPVRGDHSPTSQLAWLEHKFAPWLRDVPAKRIIGIAGNHDFVWEKARTAVDELHLPWKYLQDELTEFEGVRIYGTPWVPNLPGWAFYGGDNGCTKFKVGSIPECDILLSHGPMRGYGDRVFGGQDVGCPYMCKQVEQVKPDYYVCGHIHEGYGHYRHPDVKYGVYNVAHNNEMYEPINPVVTLTE